MAAVTIVSGCPAAGKSTVAAALARRSARSVCVEVDAFFRFVTDIIPPDLPEAHTQNKVVNAAAAGAVAVYARGGYGVIIDGVIGPWFLPVFARELRRHVVEVEYIVLRTSLEETLERSGCRSKLVGEETVRRMHEAFASLGDYERHVVDTTSRNLLETLQAIDRGRGQARFDVDLELESQRKEGR